VSCTRSSAISLEEVLKMPKNRVHH
jgi:hypothetical protein